VKAWNEVSAFLNHVEQKYGTNQPKVRSYLVETRSWKFFSEISLQGFIVEGSTVLSREVVCVVLLSSLEAVVTCVGCEKGEIFVKLNVAADHDHI